ncbi:hypothetical protein K493DRAFT_320526 [Basidiobolus meristosporus CBS 931.73]|uniref:Cyclin N-terminal domain-containing protein n=1 Tax=Basidiobolus meristosporus CBS 931.73 TaxID=1314790 RepID=A0A1Y1X8M3_9FUNG|nr:hypothetical protein K493DRAFT_320526 [Basidiobolus meristosporus CBS 931.73]|eukprot:ORX82088.1 hypothetical protein K493DRAFT_320526 [Basidiobolus meristosporus CBS 931.73]
MYPVGTSQNPVILPTNYVSPHQKDVPIPHTPLIFRPLNEDQLMAILATPSLPPALQVYENTCLTDFATQIVGRLWHGDTRPQYFPLAGFRKLCYILIKSASITAHTLALILRYVALFRQYEPYANTQPGSEFRAIIVATILANKYLEDKPVAHRAWADITNVTCQELSQMEMEFLCRIHFQAHVTSTQMASWVDALRYYQVEFSGFNTRLSLAVKPDPIPSTPIVKPVTWEQAATKKRKYDVSNECLCLL